MGSWGLKNEYMEEFKLLLALNRLHLNEVTNNVIKKLTSLNDPVFLSSGDDSGLENLWEEIWVQVQEEESFHWDAYATTIKQHIEGELANTPKEVVDLLAYIGGIDDADDVGESVDSNSIESAIKQVYDLILERANSYTNERIENYLYPLSDDDEENEDGEEEWWKCCNRIG